jgi:hypothetical protein
VSPLSDPRERQIVLTCAAAAAAHGLLSSGWNDPAQVVDTAWKVAEAFVAKTEQEAAAKGIKL